MHVTLQFAADRRVQMAAVLCLALAVRLVAAQSPGHAYDLGVNAEWALSAAQLGLARSYVEQLHGNVLPNYPPLIIILFWLAAKLHAFAIAGNADATLTSFNIIVRFPAIAADLAICVVLARVARDIGAPRVSAWIALAYALHPAAIYDSSFWGQTDAIYALWMLLALHAAAKERWAAVGVWTACALLSKPQAAAMLPVLAMLMFRDVRSIAPFAVRAIAAGTAILLPFIIGDTAHAVLAVYGRTVGGYYDAVSMGAYNFWAIFHRTAQQSDTALAFGLVSFRSVGLLLCTSATLWVLWTLRRALLVPRTAPEHLLGILLAGALTTSAVYIFATEMHERYQFAFVVLALPMAMLSIPGAVLYVATSCLIQLNLLGSMAFGSIDVALFQTLPALPKAIGVAQVILFVWTVATAPRLVGGTFVPHPFGKGDAPGKTGDFPGRSVL